jgi:hypothetical protein
MSRRDVRCVREAIRACYLVCTGDQRKPRPDEDDPRKNDDPETPSRDYAVINPSQAQAERG